MALLFFSKSVENDTAFFDSFETSHLKVLKKRFGDFVDFTDGKGNIYHARLSSVERNSAKALILSKENDLSKENKVFLEIVIASSKWEREKMLIEKLLR